MSSESSSEDENAEKFKEAVWSFQPRATEAGRDGGRTVKASKRVDVREHDYDGNELQTTPEFRSHVAGKLTAMLDRFITEVTSGTPDTKPEPKDDGEEEEDEGFRLFSTSLPGRCSTESPQQLPSKRPLPPSSSDSDSEMELRLREAAVRVSDLVPFFTEEPQKNRDTEEDRTAPTEEEEERKRRKKKRKKKKKAPTEEREEEKLASSKTRRTIHS